MSQKFSSSIQHRGDVSYVKLAGVIDEDNELSELVDKIPNGTAVIDLGEIERINSCGVRDWVNWLSKLEGNGTRSVLVEASDMGPPPHEPPTCRCDECDLVMDFDDMPDSYFAFLSNQRKLAEPDKINGAMKELCADAAPGGPRGKGKVKSRASQPNLSAQGGKPSVPSLPSIQRSSTQPASGSRPPGMGSKPPSQPGLAGRSPSSPPNSMRLPQQPSYMTGGERVVAQPGRGNGLVFALVIVLIAAIVVLAYVVLTK